MHRIGLDTDQCPWAVVDPGHNKRGPSRAPQPELSVQVLNIAGQVTAADVDRVDIDERYRRFRQDVTG
jgi:hypothetical protein